MLGIERGVWRVRRCAKTGRSHTSCQSTSSEAYKPRHEVCRAGGNVSSGLPTEVRGVRELPQAQCSLRATDRAPRE